MFKTSFCILSSDSEFYLNRGCFDVCEDDAVVSTTAGDENLSDTDQQGAIKVSLKTEDQAKQNDSDHLQQRKSLPQLIINGPKKYSSGSLLPDNLHSAKKSIGDFER